MGLDMYLYLRKHDYKSQHRFDNPTSNLYPEELKDFEKEISERNFASIFTNVDYQVGYWRKANAIHNWFVEQCADGVDNCQDILVPIEKAEELKALCEEVLKDHNKAKELLPTCDGFFFGTTEYDDWYFEDLEYTIDILGKVIEFVKSHDDYRIVYCASW